MKDAPVIVLDEAMANVDPENEKELIGQEKEAACWEVRKDDQYGTVMREDADAAGTERNRNTGGGTPRRQHHKRHWFIVWSMCKNSTCSIFCY